MRGPAAQRQSSPIERSPKPRSLANGQKGKISHPSRIGENFSPSTKPPLTEDAAILSFTKAIEGYSEGELATAGKATKDAAKSWKRGDTMPRSVALINMSIAIPEVWDWIIHARGAQPNRPGLEELLENALQQVRRHGGGGE